MDWNSYHRIDDIYGYLNYLADTYPRLVQLVSIGSSFEGRPLYVVRISSSSSGTNPAIWIDGGTTNLDWNTNNLDFFNWKGFLSSLRYSRSRVDFTSCGYLYYSAACGST